MNSTCKCVVLLCVCVFVFCFFSLSLPPPGMPARLFVGMEVVSNCRFGDSYLVIQNATIFCKSPVILGEIFVSFNHPPHSAQGQNPLASSSRQVHYSSGCFKRLNYCPRVDINIFRQVDIFNTHSLIFMNVSTSINWNMRQLHCNKKNCKESQYLAYNFIFYFYLFFFN